MPESSRPPAKTQPRAHRGPWIAALHVFVLWSFAVAQPLYDRLGTRLRYFNDVGIEPSTLPLVAVILSVLIPALLLAAEWLVGKVSSRARSVFHVTVMATLVAAALLPVLRHISFVPGLILVPLAVLGGAAFVWAYQRRRWCSALLTAASPGIVVFPLWFLFLTPVSDVLFPKPRAQAGTARASRPTPIVMIVLDELCVLDLMTRNREIDPTLFPNFSALSHRATWFRNATTVHPFTDSAVSVLLTGQYPRELKRPTIAQHPINLFSLLAATDQYELVVFEPYTRLFPVDQDVDVRKQASLGRQLTRLGHDLSIVYADHLLPTDFPIDVPQLPLVWVGFRGGYVPPEKREGVFRYSTDFKRAEQVVRFRECLQPRGKPTLYFMHLVLPHVPWVYLPSGRKYKREFAGDQEPAGGLGEMSENWGPDELVVNEAWQRYFLQLQYVDRLLGQLIERLEEVGLYDSALLIVTADHGVCFATDHARRMPEDDTLGDILAVPLFIKTPGQHTGGPTDRNVESVDVLPTILDAVRYRPLPPTDGCSLLDPTTSPRNEKLFFPVSGSEPRRLDARFPQARESLQRLLKMREEVFDGPTGPAPELVGTDVSELARGPESGFRCVWNYASDEVFSSPTALLPCLVQGELAPAPTPKEPATLAVAVNGTIAGVTRTHQLDETPGEWSLFFPEHFLRMGKNSFALYEVQQQSGRPVLCPVKTKRSPKIFLK